MEQINLKPSHEYKLKWKLLYTNLKTRYKGQIWENKLKITIRNSNVIDLDF